MPSESTSVIPIAVIAAIVTFLLTSLRQFLDKWLQSLSSLKEVRINWYREVIRIAREAQIDVMSGRAGLMAYESITPENEEAAFEMVDLQPVLEELDDDDLSEDELTREDVLEALEDDYDSIVEVVNEGIEESLDTDTMENQLQNDLTKKYNQLKTHWASVEFEVPDETEKSIDELLQELYVNALYQGISEEDAQDVNSAAKRVIRACNSDIESIENKKTKKSLKKKFD